MEDKLEEFDTGCPIQAIGNGWIARLKDQLYENDRKVVEKIALNETFITLLRVNEEFRAKCMNHLSDDWPDDWLGVFFEKMEKLFSDLYKIDEKEGILRFMDGYIFKPEDVYEKIKFKRMLEWAAKEDE